MLRTILVIGSLFLTSCAAIEKDTTKIPLVLEPASYASLPGWGADMPPAGFFEAFAQSCERILRQDPGRPFGPDGVGGTFGDWQPICRVVPQETPSGRQGIDFIERWFMPYQATAEGEEEGLFTGYYEPTLEGSLTRYGPYQHPLYKRPDDLVMVDLGLFRDELRGQRIAGRVSEAYLRPYEDRQQITEGQWPHNDEVLVWVDDSIDSFFLHIQGSGRVNLAEGGYMRVGYAGQNGHVYYAIGRELIKRGYMDKEDVSLQSIRAWLEQNPGKADEIMYLNRSYIFFHDLGEKGLQGGEGVALTPERSLAIDRSKIPYGLPVWVDIEPPIEGEVPLRRLMVAQDTGGAIRGAVRGDVFWGDGDRAAYLAGHMKSKGQYWFLLPKE